MMERVEIVTEELGTEADGTRKQTMMLNMGPQHPSTHGVLRVVLYLDGEIVKEAVPHIGYLHRGIEKLCEDITYQKCLPYTDRMDYLASICNNIGFILAVEKLLGIEDEIPERAKVAEVIMFELGRIESHLIGIGANAMDLGAMTAFLFCFKERERIYEILEMVCGARLTTSYPRVGGLPQDLPEDFSDTIRNFLKIFPETLNEIDRLLTRNKIWIGRTKGVAVISKEQAIDLGITGPILRGSGVPYDVRKAVPYLDYENYEFDIPVANEGDAYARYLCRMEEMRQSLRIIEQALENLPDGPYIADLPDIVLPEKELVYTKMESLIRHFVLVYNGFETPPGEIYHSVENPKGELGYYIVSDGTGKPYRMRVRGPSFVNLQALPDMVKGGFVSDVVAAIGSIDIVLGEVDR
ncbi:MAG: NADH dehydrogenase (quinone) subunit D [Candidatus Dadabacteria bacterium]|nr:NADH dehydrogenase (quinone) subunit D [Candidatus Dadabacteria bacterium]MYA48210.1 NADH dehydrogenase (quinone) subunit D [Candidatus Dadabacteria bacterium]MYF48033.1 NADH dehydrogenase (quinone) subunit D [Candidatus Dadabacteria bacterium]MYG83401.1 NADH dehydrogenase (quinone) subunit D [Candidatus Dadabacteria bacterium]MYK49565.1 NADH dehydrogenase (quinone) subunit D [Candidatus Dadabacteria bacterium]